MESTTFDQSSALRNYYKMHTMSFLLGTVFVKHPKNDVSL